MFVNQTYQFVRRGQPLFTIYSPDLVATESEYLIASGAGATVGWKFHRERRQRSTVTDRAAAGSAETFRVPAREIVRLQREGTTRTQSKSTHR